MTVDALLDRITWYWVEAAVEGPSLALDGAQFVVRISVALSRDGVLTGWPKTVAEPIAVEPGMSLELIRDAAQEILARVLSAFLDELVTYGVDRVAPCPTPCPRCGTSAGPRLATVVGPDAQMPGRRFVRWHFLGSRCAGCWSAANHAFALAA